MLQCVSGSRVTAKPAKSRINATRDWALREAEKKLKARLSGSTVRIDWKNRCVQVDDASVFAQSESDLTGTFSPRFNDFSF